MGILNIVTVRFAEACKYNPFIVIAATIMYYFFFNIFEAIIEQLIFGERFVHFLDPIFCAAFIAFSGYAVYVCAILNRVKEGDK